MAQGWSLRAACVEVGVSRSARQRWKNSARVRRPGDGTVLLVPPLEPLAVHQISPRFLSEDERVKIADLASRGLGLLRSGESWAAQHRRSAASCDASCIRRGGTAPSTLIARPRSGDAGSGR
jgi:hypothetical protein